MTDISTQRGKVLARLRRGKSITPLQALYEFGCLRLAARIKELRDDGHEIHTDMSEGYARYVPIKMMGAS